MIVKNNAVHWHNLLPSVHRIEYVRWSSSYSTGIKLIDDQHKDLLLFVNNLCNDVTVIEVDEHDAYFRLAIGHMVSYIKKHFAAEEQIMVATQFPGYYSHKRTHESFILTVVKSVKDYEAGKRMVLNNLINFLKNWVFAHIAIMDVQYIDHFKKNAECHSMKPA